MHILEEEGKKKWNEQIFYAGLTGPRGKPGRSGIPGVPGIPGVNTWIVNSTDPRRIVLVPPSILGVEIIVSLVYQILK